MSELTAFLKSRRARLRPQDVGLTGTADSRRVPGLRREELAARAGVSVDYYVRLEQGRSPNVSDQVLEAVAGALELNPAETQHLKALARPAGAPQPTPRPLRPALRRILDARPGSPAFISGAGTEVLAWNRAADAVFGFSRLDPAYRNSAWYVFTHPDASTFYQDWAEVAAEFVAWLHSETARRPQDPELASLIGRLSIASSGFRTLWARHDVHERTHGVKRLRHPEAGELTLLYEVLTVPGEPSMVITIFVPEQESGPTADRLARLAEDGARGGRTAPG